MVAVNGREVISRAVGIIYTYCNWFFNRLSFTGSTGIGDSIPSVRRRAPIRVALNDPASKSRKKGRGKPKRYNDLAKDNSTVFFPGGFRRERLKGGVSRKHVDRDLEGDIGPINSNPESTDGVAANERGAPVVGAPDPLIFDEFRRESQQNAHKIPERVRQQVTERKAQSEEETEVEEEDELWKMRELERCEEGESAARWKDRRLAQLERETRIAQSQLAREKIERQHSRLQRVFKEQRRRREDEERWRRQMEKDAKSAAQREENLLRENVILWNNLRATENAFRRARNEREHVREEMEEERVKRLRAEESLERWKELMKEYFPGGQPPRQHPSKPQEQDPPPQPHQNLSLRAQFDLYETKWNILRSGIDVDGTKVHLISFSQIPWPVINMIPAHPSQIKPQHIQHFFMHPLGGKPDAQGKGKNKRMRAMDELMRWHSDKFNQIVLSKVRDEDKHAASEVGEMVARILVDMLK